MKITDEEIHAEVRLQIAPFAAYCSEGTEVRATLGWTPAVLGLPGAVCLQPNGKIPLDFTVTRSDDGGIHIFIRRIGDYSRLARLSRGQVYGERRIPDHVFRPDDLFQAAYSTEDGAIKNYTVYTEIAQRLNPSRIFEVGVRAGYSAYAMLAGAPEAHYHGVDLNMGTDGGCVGFTEHAMGMLPREFPDASIVIEYADSQALDALPGARFDLVHVDGNHSHVGTLHDLELASRCADWVLIDDVDYVPTVGSAVIEFLEYHPAVTAIHYPTWRGHVLIGTSCLT